MISRLAICSVALLLIATQVRAETIEEKVEICAGCHGADGKPIDKTIPTIWGQQAGYLYIQLRDFKRGDRKSDIMQPIASQFERDDMLAIGEYFSQKPWPDLGQPRAPKDVAAKAVSASGSVGCPACHLDHFQGDGTVPRLAGMGRDYLARTIADFRTRARGNNPGMSDLMLATSPDDLAALVDYLAGL
ncbi:cytochrome c [Bradyrhizobium sp. LTSP885]|uniref:c-type cytochrome n=1 Tax=Bradyrhizobium sp. LTSP885 TaxID=1619232 RepID=UPI0005C938F8|nr:c-type cytochrome [Bradyrhizobium sp. LTSP885]KJC40454.1 cytochrome c [Bradyrhizobium sp. LTSP885]